MKILNPATWPLITILSCAAATAMAMNLKNDFRLIVPDEVRSTCFTPAKIKDFCVVRHGNGKVGVKVSAARTPLDGAACSIDFQAGKKGLQLWLRTDHIIPNGTSQISWWMYTRGLTYLNFDAVIETPQGKLQLYKVNGRTDDFWSRGIWAFIDRKKPRKEIAQIKPTGKWHFRGWLLWFPAHSRGKFKWGEVIFSKNRVRQPSFSWSLRDVDLSKRWMGAYSGFRIAYEAAENLPAAPLGAFLYLSKHPKSLNWQITTGSGKVIDAGLVKIDEVKNVRQTSLKLPELPVGNYWMRVKVFGENRKLLNQFLLSYLIHRSPVCTVPNIPSQNNFDIFEPDKGNLSINVNSADSDIIPIKVRNTDADEITWELKDGANRSVAKGAMTLPAAKNVDAISVRLRKPLSGPECYELVLAARKDKLLLDERTCTIYVNAPFVDSPKFRQVNYLDGAFELRETDYRSLFASQDKGFVSFVDYAKKNHAQIFLCCYWDDIEPAPGFFQFPILDKRLAIAAEYQTPAILTIYGHMDHLPRWLWYEQLLDQGIQNRQFCSSYLRRFSPASTRTLDSYANMIRHIVRRYKDQSVIAGWNFSQGIESFWSDSSYNKLVVGYNSEMAKRFGGVLPQPLFSNKLDLRSDWLRFESMKQDQVKKVLEQTFSAIRAIDREKPIYQYTVNGAGDPNQYLPIFKKYNATACFGAGESVFSPFIESLCRQAGVALDGESSGVPPQLPTLMVTLFNRLAYGAWGGGINIQWGRFFNHNRHREIKGVKELARWFTRLNKLPENSPDSSGLAIGVGVRSQINLSRSFMWPDWVKLNTYLFGDALIHALRASAQVGFVTETSPQEYLAKWPAIIFLESPILSQAANRNLVQYVRSGGKLILQGNTGRYEINGKETWHLRKSFDVPFASEKPVKFGKGWVQWLKKPINFRASDDLLKKHLSWTGCIRPVEALDNTSTIWYALRSTGNKNNYFLILLGKNWHGGRPAVDSEQKRLTTLIRFNKLHPGSLWQLTDIASGRIIGKMSSEQLASGLKVSVAPVSLKIIRLEKLPSSKPVQNDPNI